MLKVFAHRVKGTQPTQYCIDEVTTMVVQIKKYGTKIDLNVRYTYV